MGHLHSEGTVYAVFPTKLGLFAEAIGVAMAGDDRPVPIVPTSSADHEFLTPDTVVAPDTAMPGCLTVRPACLPRRLWPGPGTNTTCQR